MKHLLTAMRQTALRIPVSPLCCCAAALLLTAAAAGGQFAPWSLAAVAVAGVGWPGLSAVACACGGALLFMDFQPGLRHGAAALLIFCADTALCTTRLYTHPCFRSTAAVCAMVLTQLPYLAARGGRLWALCTASAVLLYGLTALLPALLPESTAAAEDRRRARLLLVLGVCGALAQWTAAGFSPAGVLAALTLLVYTEDTSVSEAAASGALAGLVLDLCAGDALYMTAVLCAAAAAASRLGRYPRLLAGAGFCAAAVPAAWLLGDTRPLALLCQSVAAVGIWLLLPARAGHRLPAEVPQAAAAPAAAFQAVYDSLGTELPLLRPENPAVLFDRAAEQVCRDCPLRADCWQTHYSDTYNAFNDACPALLQRGRAEAEDFPIYFSCRCVRFPRLLTALDGQLRDFVQRRAHHARLDAAYRLAREQYRQVAEALSRTAASESVRRARVTCRTASVLRPKSGERVCGDQTAVFDAQGMTCLALSDGMGSGESAHCEAAMTVRLLRQFLQSGIEPRPALRTLNTAAMLRCQGGAGFTTIDLACLDRAAGTLTLYKYGAAPSYLKRHGTVARYTSAALPAGLESADGEVPPQTAAVSGGTWLVQVSDGVAGEDDEWLQDLLAGWDGHSPRALAEELLRQSAAHGGGADDCAVSVMAVESRENRQHI